MDCTLPGSSVHGISQARTLEWVDIPFSRGSSDSGIEPGSLALQVNSLSSEPPGKTHEKQSKLIRVSPKFNDWCPCKEREI